MPVRIGRKYASLKPFYPPEDNMDMNSGRWRSRRNVLQCAIDENGGMRQNASRRPAAAARRHLPPTTTSGQCTSSRLNAQNRGKASIYEPFNCSQRRPVCLPDLVAHSRIASSRPPFRPGICLRVLAGTATHQYAHSSSYCFTPFTFEFIMVDLEGVGCVCYSWYPL